MREILLTSKETQERPTLLRDVVADGAAQHRIAGLEGIEYGALSDRARDLDFHLAPNIRQGAEMMRECDSDHPKCVHASVCTSTESTAGRSRTIGTQLSPASADAYTCPPVVPKYTPQESSESTAMASRNTFT
jgi:hypothetical protein